MSIMPNYIILNSYLFRSQDGPANHGRVNIRGEVLAGVSDLDESSSVVAHDTRLQMKWNEIKQDNDIVTAKITTEELEDRDNKQQVE